MPHRADDYHPKRSKAEDPDLPDATDPAHTASPCELCGRRGMPLTRHHLIPKTRHTNKRNKRDFDRAEVKLRLAMLCRACHSLCHAVLSEKEMELSYNTVEALAAHPEIARFVEWIRHRPPGFKPQIRSPRR